MVSKWNIKFEYHKSVENSKYLSTIVVRKQDQTFELQTFISAFMFNINSKKQKLNPLIHSVILFRTKLKIKYPGRSLKQIFRSNLISKSGANQILFFFDVRKKTYNQECLTKDYLTAIKRPKKKERLTKLSKQDMKEKS